MIYLLLALASASLFGLLGLVVYLLKRLSHLETQQALTKASLLAKQTRAVQADDIFDEDVISALDDLVDFLRYNGGDLREGLDTYFTGALDDTHIQEELQEVKDSVESLEQEEFQNFEEVQIAVQDKLQEIFQEITERLER